MYPGLLVLPALAAAVAYTDCKQGDGSLHDFELTTLDGSRNVSLSEYAGTIFGRLQYKKSIIKTPPSPQYQFLVFIFTLLISFHFYAY